MTTKHCPEVYAPDFVIDSEEKVNQVLRELATLADEQKRVTAQSRALLTSLKADERALRYRHDDALKAFAVRKIAEMGGRRKSVVLLQGTLAFCSVPRRVTLTEAADALIHAQRRNWKELMTTVTHLDCEAYLHRACEHLEKTGEKLPGIDIMPERESFSIRFGKSEE